MLTTENLTPADGQPVDKTGQCPAGTEPRILPAYIGCSTSSRIAVERALVAPRASPQFARARASDFIADAAVENLLAAAAHAVAIGLPPNSFRTIHLGAAGIETDQAVRAAIMKFIKLVTAWLRSKGEATSIIWVRETGTREGQHVHLLIYLPSHLSKAFIARQQGWLIRCGGKRGKGAFLSRIVGRHSLNAPFGDEHERERFLLNLGNVIGYMLKGARQSTVQHHKLPLCSYGGIIIGKRCGTSQNIGRTARGAAIASERDRAAINEGMQAEYVSE